MEVIVMCAHQTAERCAADIRLLAGADIHSASFLTSKNPQNTCPIISQQFIRCLCMTIPLLCSPIPYAIFYNPQIGMYAFQGICICVETRRVYLPPTTKTP